MISKRFFANKKQSTSETIVLLIVDFEQSSIVRKLKTKFLRVLTRPHDSQKKKNTHRFSHVRSVPIAKK